MLPQQLLMLQAAAGAIDDARLPSENQLRTGVFLGIALDLNTTNFHVRWSLLHQAQGLNDALPPLTANRTLGALGSVIASRIAREYHCGGPSFTVSSEETSGLQALQLAVRLLQQGELDQAVVGAVDLAGDVRAMLSDLVHFEDGARGEGAVAIVLKRHEDALRAGDRIYAVIKGVGSAVGGGIDTVCSAEAQASALRRACAEAAVRPETLGYVETDVNGLQTRVGHTGAA